MKKVAVGSVRHLAGWLAWYMAGTAYRGLPCSREVVVGMTNAMAFVTGHAAWQLQLRECLLVRTLLEELSLQHVTSGADIGNGHNSRRRGAMTAVAGRACGRAQIACLNH